MARIFISYSHKDKQVLELVRHLRCKYCCERVWFDKHLKGGEKWRQRILEKIDESDLFLFLVSDNSLSSTYCLEELQRFLAAKEHDRKKQVLPVIISSIDIPPEDSQTDAHRALFEFQCVDMSRGLRNKEALRQLDSAIDNCLPKRLSSLSASLTCKLIKILIILFVLIMLILGTKLVESCQNVKPLPDQPWITVNLSEPVQDLSIFTNGNSSWRFDTVFDTETEVSAGIATQSGQQDWSDYSVLEMQIYPQQALDGCLAQLYIKFDNYVWANGDNTNLKPNQWNQVTANFSQMAGANRRLITPNLENIREYGWKIFCPIGDTHTVSFNVDDIHLAK